jgi:hypothetical protein
MAPKVVKKSTLPTACNNWQWSRPI